MRPLDAYPLNNFDAHIQSGYGWRVHPVTGERTFHTGVDIGSDGDLWIACFAGIVRRNTFGDAYGESLIVARVDGTGAFYAHGKRGTLPPDGTQVRARQFIGAVGSTGNTTGPHLHFQLHEDFRRYDSHLDPTLYLEADVLNDADKQWLKEALTASEARTWSRLAAVYSRLGEIERMVKELAEKPGDGE